jgi:hypothetical protein
LGLPLNTVDELEGVSVGITALGTLFVPSVTVTTVDNLLGVVVGLTALEVVAPTGKSADVSVVSEGLP